ncbi:MAG: alpha-glucosidase/alpha-galactosidase [Chloroflexota bacterium]|nr:MAG: alpha-glucosidase/alpha-galactosidase [Chloroflexota bacterium]
MIKPPKIVVLGAGSAIFGLGALARIIQTERLRGAHLAMVDIDREALDTLHAVAEKMNAAWDARMTITSTTDRREALPGADFVIVSIQVGPRETVWEMDWKIPLRHGVRQPYAENGGPGAFAHTARNLPAIVGIARDMEQLCPNAWYLNLTNPLIRLTWAVHRYTRIKKVMGLCHQLMWGYAMAMAVLGDRYGVEIPEGFHVHTDADNMPRFIPVASAGLKHLDIKAAGINHFSWVYEIRDRQTGEDLYPLLRERWFNSFRRDFEPLTREVFQIFGMMPTAGDSHMCEYLSWVHDPITKPWEKYDLKLQSWEGNRRRRETRRALAAAIASGKQSVDELRDLHRFAILNEPVPEIICAIAYNDNYYSQQLNILNNGLIPNLPDDSIVEVPGIISGMGIQGLGFPALPDGIAELCRRELVRSRIVVEAAATGDKNLALQALLLDPMVTDIDTARAILDDFLVEFADYLPQFAREKEFVV